MLHVGIAGASGYTGAELMRLCASHPGFEVVLAGAQSQAGRPVSSLYPSLAPAYPDTSFRAVSADDLSGCDVVFLALPHGESQRLLPGLEEGSAVIVDLSADFRLHDPMQYQKWYGLDHACPELLERFVYGLPELFRTELRGARLIAAPGCYPTAAALALAPLVRGGVVQNSGIVVDAASGVSGAGRKPAHSSHFNTVDEDFIAYGLLNHRHTPEIEQATGAEVIFTPHLAPMNRGILATCYARPASSVAPRTSDVLDVLQEAYHAEPFVIVSESSPSTKATLGSNCAHLTARVDERTGWVIAICAIDNLVKGASGQAVQCANIASGLAECEGLPTVGVYP